MRPRIAQSPTLLNTTALLYHELPRHMRQHLARVVDRPIEYLRPRHHRGQAHRQAQNVARALRPALVDPHVEEQLDAGRVDDGRLDEEVACPPPWLAVTLGASPVDLLNERRPKYVKSGFFNTHCSTSDVSIMSMLPRMTR